MARKKVNNNLADKNVSKGNENSGSQNFAENSSSGPLINLFAKLLSWKAISSWIVRLGAKHVLLVHFGEFYGVS